MFTIEYNVDIIGYEIKGHAGKNIPISDPKNMDGNPYILKIFIGNILIENNALINPEIRMADITYGTNVRKFLIEYLRY